MTRTRSIVAIGVGALVVVVWYVTLLSWQRNERARLATRLEAAERQEKEFRTTLSELRLLAQDTEARKAELTRLAGQAGQVPPDPEVARFILAANHAALAAGVDWVSFAPGATVAGTGAAPSSVPVAMEVRGRYPSLLAYLRRLETLERLVVIDSIQVSVAGVSPDVELSVSIASRIFTGASVAPATATGAGAAGAGARRMKEIRTLLAGEHRREVILGAGGLVFLVLVLAMKSLGGGAAEDPFRSLGAAAALPAPTPTPSDAVLGAQPPRNPASLRDPFCPLVGVGLEQPPVCRPPLPDPGGQVVGLDDVFTEGGVPLARFHVGPLIFPNLHEGEVFASSFTVVSLSGRCGEFLFLQDRFTLCEGEESLR